MYEDETEEHASGPHVPIGRYRARAISDSAQLGRSEKGTEFIALVFEIIDESYPHLKGQFLQWRGYFTEKAESKTLESLRLAGWSNDEIDEPQGIGDTEVDITVEHKPWSDGKKITARVAWVNRPGTGPKVKSPMSPADKKAFAAKMKGKAILSRQGSATPKPKNSAPSTKVEDDLPF